MAWYVQLGNTRVRGTDPGQDVIGWQLSSCCSKGGMYLKVTKCLFLTFHLIVSNNSSSETDKTPEIQTPDDETTAQREV